MAISTIYTFLMKGSAATVPTYSKLVCVDSFPDLGNPPEQIDVSTLCDTMRHYIPGIQDTGTLQFECFYTAADYQTLKALEGVQTPYAVWFGGTAGTPPTPTGSNGKFSFTGDLRVTVNGGGVNEAVKMTITIYPSTDITFAAS